MTYTVKQLSTLAGVSVRTLHYYDEIGLLEPASLGANGYRYYGDEAVLRLQQILFFKELEFSLDEIKEFLDQPGFDIGHALLMHKVSLKRQIKRLNRLIGTIDKTMLSLKGEIEMDEKGYFDGFSEEKQKQYEQEIRQRYGEKAFQGTTDWNSYTPEQQAKIKAEGESIYSDLARDLDKGYDSLEVQKVIARWRQHLRYFYEPTTERLLGLARLYNEHPDFEATFRKIHPELPEFMENAIKFYCQNL
jgi:MerR family transcriptional regulator, thiopeptide resistance regulator